jgi:ADP-ribose pyrophosphatase YjhB (NUDIX family)
MSEIEVIARGLILDGGRVLLCRNVKHGYYYLPGGHVEFGEAAAAAVARELQEECGLQVRVGECGLVTEGVFETKRKQHHEVNIVFHVEPIGSLDGVKSLEAEIAFDLVELAALTDLDVRPEAIKAWLVAGRGTGCEFHSEVSRGT